MYLDFLIHYLQPAAFVQAVLLAFFLIGLKKGSQKQNRSLAGLLIIYGVLIGSRFIWENLMQAGFKPLLTFCLDFRFLIGPFFYLYLRSVFKPSRQFKIIDLLHSGIIILVILFQVTSQQFWLQPWQFFITIDLLQLTVYILWSLIEFKWWILFTNPAKLKMDPKFRTWLLFFILSTIATLCVLIFSLLMVFQIVKISNWTYWIARLVGLTNFVFINTIVYLALKIPDLFISIKYKNGELPDAIRDKYRRRLIHYMEMQRPYLDPSLSLNSLANELSMSPKHLSQTINHSFQKNFYHYINGYRIHDCIKLMSDDAWTDSNILEVAYEVGFNSKNTFNSAFKKITGMTPTEFKKHQLNPN